MEPNLTETQQPSSKIVPAVLAGVLIAALVAGGGVYAYEKNQNDTAQADLQSQIDTLKSQANAAKTPPATPISTSTPQSTPTPTIQATSTPNTLQTYTSSAYHFAFTYPQGWSFDNAVSKVSSPYDCKSADGLCLLLTDNHPAPHGTDQHYLVKLRVTKPVKALAADAYSAQTLNTYLKTYYKNVQSITLGGLSGYSAQPTDQNQEDGQPNAVYYFIPQRDNSIVSLWEWQKNAVNESIISSIKFNQ